MRYKVQNMSTANALKDYWNRAYGIQIEVVDQKHFIELFCKEIKMNDEDASAVWRNINDAFVAGRMSMGG